MTTQSQRQKFQMQIWFHHDDIYTDEDTPADRATSAVRLAGIFCTAFQCAVSHEVRDHFDMYTFHVEGAERAEAIREMLEWITTANVNVRVELGG